MRKLSGGLSLHRCGSGRSVDVRLSLAGYLPLVFYHRRYNSNPLLDRFASAWCAYILLVAACMRMALRLL